MATIATAPPPIRHPAAGSAMGMWAPRSFAFGPFVLQPERQLLLRDEMPVRIGGRALDILTILVERPGQIVGKRELLELVWPHVFVDDSNLKANVSSLRRMLGDVRGTPRYIATIVGRGYRFVAAVRVHHTTGMDP